MLSRKNLALCAETLLFYTLLVIVWGAWVRISHSGDGCGDHWPLCQGELIPGGQVAGKTWVEYAHRLMSGLYGLVVFYLWLCGRKFPDLKRSALAVLIFMIIEALLGAKLVLFKLVGSDASHLRVFVISLHYLNSFLLVAASTVFAEKCKASGNTPSLPRKDFVFPALLAIIGVTGAMAALSTTLFPSENLWQGLQKDFSADSHFLLKVRIWHPIAALLLGGALYAFILKMQIGARKIRQQFLFLIAVEIVFGLLTLFLLSPIWMKLTHLLLAHAIGITLIRLLLSRSSSSPR